MGKNIILSGKEYSKNSELENIAQTVGLNPFVTTQFFEDTNPNERFRHEGISLMDIINSNKQI